MSLRVIGAGLGRTGTFSLKIALERLLDSKCYHMFEVFQNPHHVSEWHRAAMGDEPDWNDLFDGYAAAIDWPAASYYAELSRAYPEALVIHSIRDPRSWWESASSTIFPTIDKRGRDPEMKPWREMIDAMMRSRFTPELDNRDACIEAFERHNEEVRRTIPASRLLTWSAADGWGPLCAALGVPVPDEPFPRANTKEEFLALVAQ